MPLIHQTKNQRTKPICSLDTECTGPDFRNGDRPFSVAICWPIIPGTAHPLANEPTDDINLWETKFILWPVDPFTRKVSPAKADLDYLRKIIASHRIIFHNAKFDIRALESVGVSASWRHYDDTLLASHVCDTGESHKLKDLALKYLDIPDDDEKDLQELVVRLRREAKKLGWNLADNPKLDYWLPTKTEICNAEDMLYLETYNVLDAKRTMGLWLMYQQVLKEEGLYKNYERERQLQAVIYNIESNGVTVNRSTLNSELERYTAEANTAFRACREIGGRYGYNDETFNLNPSNCLKAMLYENLELPILRETDSGLPSTDAETLELLFQEIEGQPAASEPHVFLSNLRTYRRNNTSVKYLTGYKEAAQVDRSGRIHKQPTYKLYHSINQVGTRTTRCSHSNPNTANISAGDEIELDGEVSIDGNLRKVFGPPTGRMWYAADYSQLQLNIFAAAAGETRLIEAFGQGFDAHLVVACEIYDISMEDFKKLPKDEAKIKRRVAKVANFSYIFDATDWKVDHDSGVPGLAQKLRKLFPHLEEFKQKTLDQVLTHGYVTTLGGYRIPVTPTRRKDGSWKHTGVCDIVQGTEGDIVKNAMISTTEYLDNVMDRQAWITLQVHDELVFDFPRERNSHREDSRPRRAILREVLGRMVKAGKDLGVTTPVKMEKILKHWSEGTDITDAIYNKDRGSQPNHSRHVRAYQQTGKYVGEFAKYDRRRKKKASV